MLEHLGAQGEIEARRLPGLEREIRPWRDLAARRRLREIIRGFRPDVVETHTAKAGFLGRLAARRERVPAIHVFHGHVFAGHFGRFKSWLFARLERFLARRAALLIAVSEATKGELVRRGVAPPEKIAVVPLGLELDQLRDARSRRGALRAELGIDQNAPLAGIVARLAPVKDHETFLAAARLVADALPAARFLVAGDGELRAALERRAAALGLGHAVRFLGWRRDLADLYGSLDCLVLSSLSEGSPVAVIEALAAGVPAAATAVGGAPELVREGETGFLAPPRDPAGLAAAMRRLLTDPPLARRLGAAGQKLVFARHHWTAVTARMAEIYRAVAAGGRPGTDA